MLNLIYGKLIYNARKNKSVTKLVTSEARFDKLSCDLALLLNDCYSIGCCIDDIQFEER